MLLLTKQVKAKKKDLQLTAHIAEKKARKSELKDLLNDINRKIFILKKEQIEEAKTAMHV
ncbi:hypothetical protein COB21_02125 [Candidatus Aerophobetes bacterium]|uniref:Uncharacterized protein n=1 Tax=Aerophobetes bacterium TaxID=2030807 RepID=A0A2A4X788_UNCAE|nr:MAG: hypothetical protein COB21_02125 [Candidatus Aerophobetes bacterium]